MLISNPNIEEVFNHVSSEALNVLMVAEKSNLDIKQLIDEANSRGVRIAGGIFPMVIHEDKYVDSGVIIKKLNFDSDTFIIPVKEGVNMENLPDLGEDVKSCVLFLDGAMRNIPDFLESLYEKYWDTVGFFGAGCGSVTLDQIPCVFSNEGLFQDAALLIGISARMNLGVKHGWEKIAGPIVANKTEGKKIIELNWRPALDVYKEIVGEHSNCSFDDRDEVFNDVSQVYPFGVYREEGEDIVRALLTKDENGAIICSVEINQNVSLNILHSNKEKLINCAGEATRIAFEGIIANDFLVVDCISRVFYLDDDYSQELESVKKAVSVKNKQLEGIVSLGEISSVKGAFLEYYNKTIVVAAFYE